MFDFTGRVVIVTGGNKGIGKEIALGFAKSGAMVAIWGRNQDDNKAVTNEIIENGGQAISVKCNVTSEEEVGNAVNATLEAFNGRIDVLINNAGVSTGSNLTWKMSLEAWRKTVEVDLTGPFICAKAVIPVMKKQRYGRIVNINSTSGQRICHLAGIHYSSAKAGGLGFTRHLSIECGPFGITVNAVCPGAAPTPLTKALWPAEEIADREGQVPMGRMLEASDLVYPTMFFAAEEAGMITGTALSVDGGAILPWYDNKTYFEKMGEPLTDD